ncbi:M15 family metallopeptidase [Aquimarina pacifica]|uniref:M15 family metallopeptidase n=1 Tax=Aquimarina pacifica TaxID=1296415 RepID=UPI0004710E20|nr:M15 family metallopeptidase [Aquimarina pacifica]
MSKRKLIALIFSVLFISCSNDVKIISGPTVQTLALLEKSKALKLRGEKVEQSLLRKKDSIEMLSDGNKMPVQNLSGDKDFVDIERISKDFVLDMRYATADNFLKEKVYSCAKCYVREEVAKALMQVNAALIKKGYKLKFFDCYRPYSVQKKMWKIFPNPGYVADPKGGSVHNRGAAVDVTLVQNDGTFVDMGTGFDHFGKEAHHSYSNFSKTIISHRKLLRETMEKYGFRTIKTEWWHYNFTGNKKFTISDYKWTCE